MWDVYVFECVGENDFIWEEFDVVGFEVFWVVCWVDLFVVDVYVVVGGVYLFGGVGFGVFVFVLVVDLVVGFDY